MGVFICEADGEPKSLGSKRSMKEWYLWKEKRQFTITM